MAPYQGHFSFLEALVLHLSFYKFIDIEDPSALVASLREVCDAHGLLGTILIAPEGINGMIAGDDAQALAAWFGRHALFSDMRLRRTESAEMPFEALKIKVKDEIVTMRQGAVQVAGATAEYLAPERLRDWLRDGEEMILVDVRNDFEHKVGTFRGALNPETVSFHEFPDVVRENLGDWRGRRVVTFCTGGIRCEKATAWMLERGFEELYQLDGGVLGYFEAIADASEDWEGSLFVFDGRQALDTDLREVASDPDVS